MPIYLKNISVSPVGSIYRETDPATFEIILYRLANVAALAYAPVRGDIISDGGLLSPTLSGKAIELSAPVTVALSDLESLADWRDYSCFGLPYTPAFLKIGSPFNIYSETYNSKVAAGTLAMRNQENYAVQIFVPSKSVTTLDDCGVCVFGPSDASLPLITTAWPTFDSSGDLTSVATITPTFTITDLSSSMSVASFVFPNLALSGPTSLAADDYGTFTVTAESLTGAVMTTLENFIVYLESTGGYVPQCRVPLVNGVGTFRAAALGLLSGDSFRIKAGTKLYTSISELTVTVE
jgi:hypothetical protein